MVVLAMSLLFLIPATIFIMPSSLYRFDGLFRSERKPRRRHHGGDSTNRNRSPKKDLTRPFEAADDDIHIIGEIYDKYEINSDASLQRFMDRTTFPPLEPRVVMLTDNQHDFRFAVPPGKATAIVPEKGLRELRAKYVALSMKNPKKMKGPDSLSNGNCEPIDPSWQLAYHPTCNQIHEASGGWQQLYRLPNRRNAVDGGAAPPAEKVTSNKEINDSKTKEDASTPNTIFVPEDDTNREQLRLVNGGAFRHVWMIRDAHDGITRRAMKTLRSLRIKEKQFDLRNHDRHRRDAMSFEELSNSPLVVDLYASCSNTAIFDYANRGDLLGIFDEDDDAEEKGKTPNEDGQFGPSKLEIMQIAYNVSMSVRDAHHFDEQGRPTMAHTDIKTDQFIYQDGYYKLSDFNRVRFLAWNSKTNEQCGFLVGKNGGEYRAPEEYAYKEETEKVDVYSLGNVLYFLLVREEVWGHRHHKEIYDLVKAGQRPKIPDEIYTRDGVFERYMIRAIESAWIHEPERRPSAAQVANIIKEGIELKKGKL